MKRAPLILLLCLLLAACGSTNQEKHRILISSDIGGTDPDDNQSMAHLLMYSDLFDIEGIVSSPSFGDGNKEEILRMVDVYEADLPTLLAHYPDLMQPDEVRVIVKQGRKSAAPACGYGEPTEGSEWIVKCARKEDKRPLHILVWGCLEDVAQALHDAPEIAPKLRVHWIAGPNKKWGVNAYMYIVEHFPNLWMIENNTTYRGFIYDSKNSDEWNKGYFEKYICDAGHLGRDFAAYYKGNPKMGDTPTLLYLMHGSNPEQPEEQSWAGRFVKTKRTPRRVFHGPTTAADTALVCGIIEWQLKGPNRPEIAVDSACLTLDIRKQKWTGYYKGDGNYLLRHSTYYTGVLSYTMTSSLPDFEAFEGEITVENSWDVAPNEDDLVVGDCWWTDSYAEEDRWNKHAGANTQIAVRQEIMADWAARWQVLKE
ncbi:MAG: DUF1593 domain-containing protein [Alistipes sp.]|nr:DUF1593 domain-containing protein [Alistipes sp.]